MKTVVFTLCSNNYLAHAKTLGDSIREKCPETEFIIGLVDEYHPDIDYTFFKPYEIIKYDQIGFDCFQDMLSRYNIIEFNTAVKPYYLEFLLNRFGAGSKVYYIDPDIKLYSDINYLNDLLYEYDILLTPNLVDLPEEVDLGELASLRHGMFNLGFLGVKNSSEGLRFISWWKKRLLNHCLIDKSKGIFVDQKWVDLAPLFFTGIHIIRAKGYNMAWWNLSERKLVESEEKYFVNNTNEKLVFFHFSGYKPGSTNFTGRNNDDPEYGFERRPELFKIFKEYSDSLYKNGFIRFSESKPKLNFGYAVKTNPVTLKSRIKKVIKKVLK